MHTGHFPFSNLLFIRSIVLVVCMMLLPGKARAQFHAEDQVEVPDTLSRLEAAHFLESPLWVKYNGQWRKLEYARYLRPFHGMFMVGQSDMKALVDAERNLKIERCHFIYPQDSVLTAWSCGYPGGFFVLDMKGEILGANPQLSHGKIVKPMDVGTMRVFVVGRAPDGSWTGPEGNLRYGLLDTQGNWVLEPIYPQPPVLTDAGVEVLEDGKVVTIPFFVIRDR